MVGGEGRVRSSWGSAASGGSAWCGGEEVVCCWAILLEEGGEGLHSFGCWGAWVVEVWGEESIDRGECGVLVGEEWLERVE